MCILFIYIYLYLFFAQFVSPAFQPHYGALKAGYNITQTISKITKQQIKSKTTGIKISMEVD